MSKLAVSIQGVDVFLGTAVVATLERELDDWTVRENGGVAIGFIYIAANAKYHTNGVRYDSLLDAVAAVIRKPGKAGRSKYGNQKTEVDGIVFDSKKEAKRYGELKRLEAAGEIHDLRRQVPIACVVNGVKVCTYRADFVYLERAGMALFNKEVVEDLLIEAKEKAKACHGIEIKEV